MCSFVGRYTQYGVCSSLRRILVCFFFQAEDGIRDLVRSRGLGDVYKRQLQGFASAGAGDRLLIFAAVAGTLAGALSAGGTKWAEVAAQRETCLLYTSDAADERSSVDLGGRRILNKKNLPRAEPGARR